jgi:hypothetical protein
MSDKRECKYDGPSELYRGNIVRCYCQLLGNGKSYVMVTKESFAERCPLLNTHKVKRKM